MNIRRQTLFMSSLLIYNIGKKVLLQVSQTGKYFLLVLWTNSRDILPTLSRLQWGPGGGDGPHFPLRWYSGRGWTPFFILGRNIKKCYFIIINFYLLTINTLKEDFQYRNPLKMWNRLSNWVKNGFPKMLFQDDQIKTLWVFHFSL